MNIISGKMVWLIADANGVLHNENGDIAILMNDSPNMWWAGNTTLETWRFIPELI